MNQFNSYPRVGFLEAIKLGFKNYVNCRDRTRRSEFWFFILFIQIISLIIFIISICTLKKVETSRYSYPYVYYYTYYEINPFVQIINFILFLATFLPLICIQIRRLHDTGKSGVYLFLHFILFVGSIILLVYYCQDSEPGQNLYGPCPKYYANEGTPIFNQYNLSPLGPNQSSSDVQLNVNPQQDTYSQPQMDTINSQNNQ